MYDYGEHGEEEARAAPLVHCGVQGRDRCAVPAWGPVNVYPFIEAEGVGGRNVAGACVLLKVSRAAFYQHLADPSKGDREDTEIMGEIRAVHERSKGRYGAPWVHAELRRRGVRCGRKRIARLLRAAGSAAGRQSGGARPQSSTRPPPQERIKSGGTSLPTPPRSTLVAVALYLGNHRRANRFPRSVASRCALRTRPGSS